MVVVELEVGSDAVPRLGHVLVGFEVDLLVLETAPEPFDEDVIGKAPRPSMLMATPWARSTPVKSSSVNWLPWSVLKISGRPWLSASSRASMQKLASSRFDKR